LNFRQHVLLLSTLILLVYGASCTLVGPCVTSLQDAFGIGKDTVGTMFAAGSIGYLFGVRLGGRLAGQIGLSWTLRGGLAVLGGGLLLVCLSPSWGFCIVGHGLSGIGGGMVEPALVSSVQILYAEKRRQALNLTQVGFGLGAIAAPYLVRTIFEAQGSWRLGFGVVGGATLGLLLVFPRRRIPSEEDVESEPETLAMPPEVKVSHARNPVLWLMSLSILFYVGGELGISSWASAYFEETHGVSKETASLAPFSLWIGLLVGRLGMWFVDHRRSSRRILAVCAATGIVFSAAALMTDRIWLAYLFLAVCGMGLGPIWPTILDHSVTRLGTKSADTLSWVIIGGGIGTLSQAVLGPIAEATSIRTALVVAVGLLVVMAFCLMLDWLLERKGRA
jgi:fucose permease